jgi:hypothetical protein
MNAIQIEVLLFIIFILCGGIYMLGRKKNIDLLRCLGKKGFLLSLVLIIAEGFILVKRGFEI